MSTRTELNRTMEMNVSGSRNGRARATATRVGVLAAILAAAVVAPCRADDTNAVVQGGPSNLGVVGDYFANWFTRVSAIQAEQPHWATPLVTVTPRLEEELRYDQYSESLPEGHTLDWYGGAKGLELIPFENIEVIIGVPTWESENKTPEKNGWADETFLLKYRILSANEDNGNYILTAFMGLSVPNGSDDYSSHHFGFTPTVAFGKGWGDFDIQSTLGVSIPDNGSVADGAGTPILSNTSFQYRVAKIFWPEVEANFTYYPNGEHSGVNQLFLTPGFVLGRLPLWGRVALTVGAGYQIAVTQHPLIRNNLVLSVRIPF